MHTQRVVRSRAASIQPVGQPLMSPRVKDSPVCVGGLGWGGGGELGLDEGFGAPGQLSSLANADLDAPRPLPRFIDDTAPALTGRAPTRERLADAPHHNMLVDQGRR